jgi:hypothetical protein
LRLTSSGGGLVLHSVGKDGIDDRGEERAETHGRNGDLTFRLGAARTLDGEGGEAPAPEEPTDE